ncbi:MAG: ornithine cyclodeaminase family protein, partial [Solirubrobacteraceae bacterium]
REGAPVLALLGAGVQARSHLRALAGVRPWRTVRVYAPSRAHVETLRELAPAPLVAARSAQEAVHDADVVVTVTSSHTPVLEHAWLKAGAHVNAVGASQPSARELETATVAAAALFCDSRESLVHEAGEFALAVREGRIAGETHIRAELGEVVAGLRPGRRDARELTLFRSLGIGVEDLAAARTAVAAARERGIGIEVAL